MEVKLVGVGQHPNRLHNSAAGRTYELPERGPYPIVSSYTSARHISPKYVFLSVRKFIVWWTLLGPRSGHMNSGGMQGSSYVQGLLDLGLVVDPIQEAVFLEAEKERKRATWRASQLHSTK